jgi:effector-binding domain-containing protein
VVSQAGTEADGRAAGEVALDRLEEGLCLQVLHVGPYENEPETLATMETEMVRRGLTMNGRHHEIYLTDLSAPPENARTILRHPVKRHGSRSTRKGVVPSGGKMPNLPGHETDATAASR